MTTNNRLPGALAYMDAVRALLDDIAATQLDAIDRAATAVTTAITADGMIYLFGTGHSHMLAVEGFHRAGGLAPVTPVLSSAVMMHEGALASSQMERLRGLAGSILLRYQPTERDVLVVFSNSGVNAVPVEMALAGKAHGMTVIGVVALDYANQVEAKIDGKKLADVADIVIDNRGQPGDALVDVDGKGLRAGPSSTVAGAFILNAILTEAATRLAATSAQPPVYISSNMPGGDEHNAGLVAKYRPRNPHL